LQAHGEAEVELGTRAGLRFRPDSAAVAQHDSPDIREPHAGSVKFVLAVEAVKCGQELGRPPWIEPDPTPLSRMAKIHSPSLELCAEISISAGCRGRVYFDALEKTGKLKFQR